MNKKDTAAFKKAIIAATNDATVGFMLVNPTAVKALVDDGDIELNATATPDANGNVPARATAKLLGATTTKAEPAAKPVFEIMSGIIPADGKRGGGIKEEIYPFSKLEVGQSFVVPVSVSQATPAAVVEKFSSTVSSATRRFAVKSATETRTNKAGAVVAKLVATRKFTLRPVKAGDVTAVPGFLEPVDGARVYRTA